MNVYTTEFMRDFEPFDSKALDNKEQVKNIKRELKEKGFHVIRSKYYTSLESYFVKGIRYRHGEPTDKILKFMKDWSRLG